MQHQGLLFLEDREKHKRSLIYGTTEFKQAYSRYIRSTQWKKLCKLVCARAKGICERCRKPTKQIETHHLTYERFQHELLSDLQGICPPCHPIADLEREQRNQRKYEEAGEDAQYSAAQDTFFTKKYGPDWYFTHDRDPAEWDEEFNNWLEQQRERDYD